ncbi:MAG TPA: peptidyl-prolyl cis-trans isomerase [Cyclobacteriaceae bacterium]|jgi:hypothetical protein
MKNSDVVEESTQSEPIARVLDHYLYPEDLAGIIGPGVSKEDSANLVLRYIKSWARKQLLINQAAANIDFNEAELERKILDYRYALMVYEFEKQYVNQEINLELSPQEIRDYYEKNKDKFELKQNIIRGVYVKIPNQAPRLVQVKNWVLSNKQKDLEELRSYCLRFATNYSLEDSVWLNFDEVIRGTPLTAITNKVEFLRKNRFVESTDDEFNYLIRIDEYRITDQISPLTFVEDQIRSIIINKRKVELTRNLEDKVFNEAVTKKDFEVYVKE